jgi:hypothetical protein
VLAEEFDSARYPQANRRLRTWGHVAQRIGGAREQYLFAIGLDRAQAKRRKTFVD